jgi:hypothetical protein
VPGGTVPSCDSCKQGRSFAPGQSACGKRVIRNEGELSFLALADLGTVGVGGIDEICTQLNSPPEDGPARRRILWFAPCAFSGETRAKTNAMNPVAS